MKQSRFTQEQIIGVLKNTKPVRRQPICAASTASATRRSTSGGRSMAG